MVMPYSKHSHTSFAYHLILLFRDPFYAPQKMTTYTLYLVFDGECPTSQNRSHRSFTFQHADIKSSVANILQVLLLDDICFVYQFDWRAGVSFLMRETEGAIRLAEMSREQYIKVQDLISKEMPQRNGKDRCQN